MSSVSGRKHCSQTWRQNTRTQKEKAKQEGFNRVCVCTQKLKITAGHCAQLRVSLSYQ